MTASEPTTVRALVRRSDDHPALVVPESGASLSYAALQRRSTGRRAGWRRSACAKATGSRLSPPMARR